MHVVPFLTAFADDGSPEGREWRVVMEAAMRREGIRVLPIADIDQCDCVIVGGSSTRATARRALDLAHHTERGALFVVWLNAREVVVILQSDESDDPIAVWRRRVLSDRLSSMDANALECSVVVLSCVAMRDGVMTRTPVRLEFVDGFPRIAGRIVHPEQGVSQG